MKKGFTLLEITVTAVLLSMVMLLAIRFLVPTMRISARGTLRVEMQQTAVVALNRLITDYERSSPAGIGLRLTAPVAVSVCPVVRVQPDGADVWSDSFILYSYDVPTRQLRRREWPPGAPSPTTEELTITKARRLGPDRIAGILAEPPARQIILAADVDSFQILQPPGATGDMLIQPVRFQLTLKRQDQTFTCTRSAFVRNLR